MQKKTLDKVTVNLLEYKYMTTIWPALLILTTLMPLFYKLWHRGERIELSSEKLKGAFGRLCLSTLLQFALLYLCGFFLVIAWPQIVWIILSAIGLMITMLFLMALRFAPNMLESMQDNIDRNELTWQVDFTDVLTYGILFAVFIFGGAFAAW